MNREARLVALRIDIHDEAKRLAFACIKCTGVVPTLAREIVDYTGWILQFDLPLKYNPDQPRVPAGNPNGGQWTNGGDEGGDILDDLIGDITGGDGDGGMDSPDSGVTPFQIVQEIPPSLLLDEPPVTVKPPYDAYPTDPTQPPAPGFQWEGNGPPGSRQGNWHNPDTDEDLHPDLDHNPPIGPHWDYETPNGKWRLYPDGRIEPKTPSLILTT